jgi:hypothetical protein
MELLPAVFVSLLAAASDDPVRRAVERVLAGGSYQTDLPSATTALPAPRVTAPVGGASIRWPGLAGAGPLMRAVIWAGVVVVVALALTALWPSMSGVAALPPPPAMPRPPPRGSPSRLTLGQVEQLASEGRFGPAIHGLLLCALHELQPRSPAARLPGLTAREVMERVHLRDPERQALGAVLAAAERVHFGGRPAGEDEYRRCLAEYHRFRGQPRAGGRA